MSNDLVHALMPLRHWILRALHGHPQHAKITIEVGTIREFYALYEDLLKWFYAQPLYTNRDGVISVKKNSIGAICIDLEVMGFKVCIVSQEREYDRRYADPTPEEVSPALLWTTVEGARELMRRLDDAGLKIIRK